MYNQNYCANAPMGYQTGMPAFDINGYVNSLTQQLQSANMENQQLKNEKSIQNSSPGFFLKDPAGIQIYYKSYNKTIIVGVFDVSSEKFVVCYNYNKPPEAYIMVKYKGESRVTDTAIIPYESFLKQKSLQYFKEFRMYGDCNKSIAEKCLYNEINKNMQNIDTIVIPEFAGFYLSNEEISFYAGNNYENKALWGIVPDAIKNRRMLMYDITASELSETLVRLMSDPLQSFLITCRIVGLISGLFKSIGISLNQMLIISSVSHSALKTVVSYLKVFNRPAFDVYSVDIPNGRLNKELKSTNGEVFVVSDISLCSNDKKRTETLDLLIKDMEIDETPPHLIAVVSNAAQYIVPVENQILVDLNDDFLSMSNEELQRLQLFFEKVDSCVIQYVCNNYKNVLAYLKQKTDLMCRPIKDKSNSNASISYSVIFVTGALLNMIFGVELMTHETVEYAYSTIIKTKQSENGNEYAVLNEFSSVLNKIISEGTLNVIPYSDDMQYRKESNMAILKNDLIFIEGVTLNNILMPEMTVCSNLTHIIKELENVNVISATNNNTHPIKITNVYGIVEHVSMYAFRYHEVLNSANIEFLENGTNNDFWISKNELPEGFIPLVCTQNTVAGRKSEYNRNENCHISITGKSGEGKTVFMSQVLAGCHKNNDKIIVFDSSGSFSRKELSRNLSESYVEDNVTYISIEEDGIPVNLFDLSGTTNLARRKNIISGVLASAVKTLSDTQSKLLNSTLSDCLEDDFNFIRLLNMIVSDKKNPVATSLSNKLASVFEDIASYEMLPDTWETVIDASKDIIIITMENSFSEKGNYIFDMLLASLFNYQTKNDDRHLSIFVDEIQNQNLGKYSPITKIIREGRKYHMGLIFATQISSNGTDIADKIVKQAGTHVFFKPDASSESTVAGMLGFGKKELYKLRKLKIGECFISGKLYNSQLGYNDSTVIKGKTYTHFDSFKSKNQTV